MNVAKLLERKKTLMDQFLKLEKNCEVCLLRICEKCAVRERKEDLQSLLSFINDVLDRICNKNMEGGA